MHTTIRRYEGISPDAVAEVIRLVETGFVPLISASPGFIGYYVVDAGDGVLAAISVFENEAASEAGNAAAAGWVQDNLASLIPNAPQVMEGSTVISAP